MSQQSTVKGYGFVHGKLGEGGVVEKCDMYHYPHVCTPRWCSPPPEGHPLACPKCGATQRTTYLSACWTDTHEWHGGMKVPPVAMIPKSAAPAPQAEPLSQQEISDLGQYNSERSRGLLHTEEWRKRMAELQSRFDSGRSRTPAALEGWHVY